MRKKEYIIGAIIIVIDQISKYLLINKKIVLIPDVLNITYLENTGGAFSIGHKNIIILLSLIIIFAIIIYLLKNKNTITNFWPFILVLSGSIGNLIDRIFRGYVIDFIEINIFNFPKFNIADISIFIGVFWILIDIII